METPQDKLRLILIQKQYKKSNVLYRMVFDKHYRPERFQCIVENPFGKKDRNELRIQVMKEYYKFPLRST
jgi:hypothetical protein